MSNLVFTTRWKRRKSLKICLFQTKRKKIYLMKKNEKHDCRANSPRQDGVTKVSAHCRLLQAPFEMRVNEIVRSLSQFKEETMMLEFVNLLIMETVESNLEDHQKIDEIEKVIYLFDHNDLKRLSKFQKKA